MADEKALDDRTEDEKLIDSILGKAAIAYISGDLKMAKSLSDITIKLNKENPNALLFSGILLTKLGELEEAIKSFDKLLINYPKSCYILSFKGNALADLGKHEAAINSFNIAIKLKPDLHDAYTVKGITLKKLGRTEEAEQAFAKAKQLKKDS